MRAVVVFLVCLPNLWLFADELDGSGKSAEEPLAASEELGVEAFFRAGEYLNPTLSPDGQHIAFRRQGTIYAGNPTVGFHKVWTVSAGHRGLDLQWISSTDLLMKTYIERSGLTDFVAFRLDVAAGTYDILDRSVIKVHGFVQDPMLDKAGEILLARYASNDDIRYSELFQLDVFGDVHWQTRPVHRLNKENDFFLQQVRDADGEFVLGISFYEGRQHIWQRNRRGDWEVTWSLPEGTSFQPMGLSPDSQTVWALSNADSDQVAAVAFDLASSTVTEVLYQHDRFDVANMLLSPDKSRPIAFAFYEDGLVQYRFADDERHALQDFLARKFENSNAVITSTSSDQRIALVGVSSPQVPGELHLCDIETDSCALVGSRRPWLDDVRFGEMRSISFTNEDGLEIDAFVTLPPDLDQSVPLIVMPHGGPIGVSDYGYYSADVQWLVYQGFAVLRVNYRGSRGYGRSFQDAGLRQWGQGIENDIMGAMQLAFDTFPVLDKDRVCIYGASYGGYSALMSVIRHPDSFRCAASFAGVTDLTLLFNESAARRNERLTERLVEMIGDPDVDHEVLVQHSPVYQYRQIQRPVFLSHGEKDSVVDVEHSWRLRKMLLLAGQDVEVHIFPKLAHSFPLTSDARAHYEPLTEFLKRHLMESSAKSGLAAPE